MGIKKVKGPRALVVDDEPAVVRTLKTMLHLLGVSEIHTAENGEVALRRLEVSDYDLVICDLNMPDCDGIETMRRFAEIKLATPLILVSGADARLLKAARNLGLERGLHIVDTLKKPFRMEDIRRSLSLAKPRSSTRNRSSFGAVSVDELRRAIAEQQLRLYYQPKLALATGEMAGVEALVRWQHPQRGLVPPGAFICVAEENGLIEPLTQWVVEAAIAQAAQWQAARRAWTVAINISALTMRQLDWPDRIAKSVAEAGLQNSQFILEVTESGVTDDLESLLDISTRLRLKGFPLSIDDFGTGFSSMAQLHRLPFTELKIDRMFVNGAIDDGDAKAVLESSISMAKRLRLTVVAEGIETERQWNMLLKLGVEMGQGYWMAKPMPASELETWFEAWQNQCTLKAQKVGG